MSPQFVDFDADGKLDIVAGIFDGSPHLARGDGKSWAAPEQILDRDGARIVMNQFWNFDSKQWDSTKRCDGPHCGDAEGHLTSAIAFDVDGDGDFDLLLGDHSTGRIMVRANEGTNAQPLFAAKNALLLADGKPTDVPGTVATLRLFDWNSDGRLDLLAGSMGDPYGDGPGGGVFVFANVGTGKAAEFGAMTTLIPPSPKGAIDEPSRPDVGLYLDAADVDGDGDPDLIVGGYSMWKPKVAPLTDEQKARIEVLHGDLEKLATEMQALNAALPKPKAKADGELDMEPYKAAIAGQKDARQKIAAARRPLDEELDKLEPKAQRKSFVWLYTNTSAVLR